MYRALLTVENERMFVGRVIPQNQGAKMAQNATKCSAADGVTQTFCFSSDTPLMVRAVDFNGLYHEHQKLIALLKDIDANMRRAWKDKTLSADAWPSDLAQRLSKAVGRGE